MDTMLSNTKKQVFFFSQAFKRWTRACYLVPDHSHKKKNKNECG